MKTFDALEIPLPPLDEQRRIAHILGSLDDKIENNRRMNATLEGIARALFKSWFVDFDPVKAKARGEQPAGMDAGTAALFPDSFEESALGLIPRGWRVEPIGNIIERLPVGRRYEQKTVSPSGKVPVLDQGKTGIIGYHDEEPGVFASPDVPIIVFANHTCYMRLMSFPFSAIQNVIPFVGGKVNTFWLYYATIGKQAFIEYKGHWPDFILHDLIVPNYGLTDAYSTIITPLLRLIWEKDIESGKSSTIRDSLLPKLISGEIKVKYQ